MSDVLAVVGSTSFVWRDGLLRAQEIIEEVLDARCPDRVISGAAKGVDGLAVQIAQARGIEWQEFRPRHNRWKPHGFAERNQKIADECSRLLRITCRWSLTYGSGWTADRASEQGKPTKAIVLPERMGDGRIQTVYGSGPVELTVAAGRVVDGPATAEQLGWLGRDADAIIADLVRASRPVWWVAG